VSKDSTHIKRETHTLAPHKPRRSMSGRNRRSILTACECAHTLAEKYRQTVYLHPTMYGWALNTRPSDFTTYVAVTPTGDCTEYVYDPCRVLS